MSVVCTRMGDKCTVCRFCTDILYQPDHRYLSTVHVTDTVQITVFIEEGTKRKIFDKEILV
jgi:hypothetical protein